MGPQFSRFVQKDYLVSTLIELVGRREAIRLCESDPAYRAVLGDWATPKRRHIARLAGHIPEKWRPRKYR